jgi:hypothetical protein
MPIALHLSMEWLTWFPSIYSMRAALAVALFITLLCLLLAVRPRAKWSRRKQI